MIATLEDGVVLLRKKLTSRPEGGRHDQDICDSSVALLLGACGGAPGHRAPIPAARITVAGEANDHRVQQRESE